MVSLSTFVWTLATFSYLYDHTLHGYGVYVSNDDYLYAQLG